MDELASRQLSALARVDELMGGAGIDHWLFGGWAVDFHAGSVTRAHHDVDIAVWLDDLRTIGRLLEKDGWRHAPSDDDDGGTGYERKPVRLELTFLVRGDDGRIYIPFQQGNVPWLDTFEGEVIELHGVRARVMGLEPLTGGKSSPRADPEDAAKDRADFAVLSTITRRPTGTAPDSAP